MVLPDMVLPDTELPLPQLTTLLLNSKLALPSSTSVVTTTVEDHPVELAERILTTSPERKSVASPLPGASAFF